MIIYQIQELCIGRNRFTKKRDKVIYFFWYQSMSMLYTERYDSYKMNNMPNIDNSSIYFLEDTI